MKKRILHSIALPIGFILAFVFSGCSKDNPPIKPSIAISMATFQIQRWPQEASTITRLANEKGLAVVTLEANNDVEIQKQHLNEFINKKIPVIIVVAVDGNALSSEIDLAHEKGIHIIAYDRLILSPKLTAYVSFDSVEVGRQQALAVLESAPSGYFVLLGGSSTDNNAHLVRKGQLDILSPYIDEGQIKIIEAPFIPNWEAHLAFLAMERILKKNGDKVDAVVASNDGTALGAIQALKLRGLDKKIPISGQDATTEGCKAIVEGDMTVSVFKDINQLAPLAFDIATKIIQKQPLKLKRIPLKDLSSGVYNDGFVPCKLLDVSRIDASNIYEKIILTQFHKWEDVYRDIPLNQRPPNPRLKIDEISKSKKSE